MHEHGLPPRARQDGLLEETVGKELLLYDQESHTAHCLSPIAACVWRHCDGKHDVTKLAELAGVSESLVADALHELRGKNLLAAESELMGNAIPGESRREAIGRVARYGAVAAAGSMIVSATAATPAMASSEEGFEFGEILAKGKWKCTPKTSATNCCVCENDCGIGKGNKELCVSECAAVPARGGYAEWKKEAVCEK